MDYQWVHLVSCRAGVCRVVGLARVAGAAPARTQPGQQLPGFYIARDGPTGREAVPLLS